MPFDLRLVNRDIVIDPFDLQLNSVGLEANAQRIAITLNTFRGEYFLDTQFGTPYYQTILGLKKFSLPLIDSELRKVILGVTGVLQLISYSSEVARAARTLHVTFKARVDDGIVDAEVTLGGGQFCLYIPPAGNNIIYIRNGQPLTPFPIGGVNFNLDC